MHMNQVRKNKYRQNGDGHVELFIILFIVIVLFLYCVTLIFQVWCSFLDVDGSRPGSLQTLSLSSGSGK